MHRVAGERGFPLGPRFEGEVAGLAAQVAGEQLTQRHPGRDEAAAVAVEVEASRTLELGGREHVGGALEGGGRLAELDPEDPDQAGCGGGARHGFGFHGRSLAPRAAASFARLGGIPPDEVARTFMRG